MLDAVLGAKTQGAFKGACDRHAGTLDRGHRKDHLGRVNGDLVYHRLWKLATGYAVYIPSEAIRKRLSGPLTWTEIEVIRLSFTSETGEKVIEPDEVYLAMLLNRPVKLVKECWDKLDPRRTMTGFGL